MESDNNTKGIQKNHKLTLVNCKILEITGVEDVASFDAKEVILATTCGTLTMKGEDLKVNRLSIEKGELVVEGLVSSMVYSARSSYGKKKESLVKRMFK